MLENVGNKTVIWGSNTKATKGRVGNGTECLKNEIIEISEVEN
jgi:hypothetical protein